YLTILFIYYSYILHFFLYHTFRALYSLHSFPTRRSSDLSGNGIIPLLLSYKSNQFIEGIEIQQQLIDMAERSIAHNQLENRIHMHHMDLKQAHQSFKPSQYSLVTCNPPYFKRSEEHTSEL